MPIGPKFRIVDLRELPGVPCPCGVARRALADTDAFPGTVHLTEIHEDARTHYHREHTETYVVLSCEPDAQIELDGQRFSIRAGTCILIPPGVRHRAVGRMEVINFVLPKFDPADEYFD
jgi:mannose-6-phosphate isomerase-like protein (cupin superfamily)